jgi:ribosome-associated translation inhibitor RaiA
MGANGRSTKRAPFAATISRADRRQAGRTWAPNTPLALRTSGVAVDPELRQRIHRRLGERLGKYAAHIQRLSVRFEDVNGPRGGVDVACRIKAVVSGLPSAVVTEVAKDPREAFDRAGERFERAVRRAIERGREQRRLGRMRPPGGVPHQPRTAAKAPASTADRNRKRRAPKATAALEGSAQPRPSRKSTRGSANRAKQGNKLARREKRRVSSRNARRAQAGKSR